MSEKMREALIVYMAAGVGNSTDYEKQADARRLATEALAEQPAQGDAVAFIANGARFKLAALPHSAAFMSFPAELAGKWVALVDATDDRHLLLKAPPAPSVPDDIAKDAARYRWMVKHCADVSLNDHNDLWHCQWRENQRGRMDWHLSDGHATADQAVDSAMDGSIAMLASAPEPRS